MIGVKVLGSIAVAAALMFAAPHSGDAASKYKEIAVSNGGSVHGTLHFSGAVPDGSIEQILITKNPDVCGEGNREVVWIDVKDGALRGAFVFLDKIKSGKKWPAPSGGKQKIDQKSCRFTPWAQVVKPGNISIINSDVGVLHNINTREMIGVEKGRIVKRTMFNFGQPDPGEITKKLKPRRSPFISLNCEAHNFMFGFMMAPKHPYAVVVGDDGSYSLDAIPAGSYKLKAWHPKLGVIKKDLKVAAGSKQQMDFTFSQ